MYWTKIPELITLEANDSSKTWWFVASISIDQNEASQSYQHAQDNKENLLTENAEVSFIIVSYQFQFSLIVSFMELMAHVIIFMISYAHAHCVNANSL